MVVIKNLTKQFPGGTVAVNEVSLHIAKGENVGLIGVNGAGKTTLIKLICGLYLPTSGFVRVFGENPFGRRIRRPCAGIISGQLVGDSYHNLRHDSANLQEELTLELNLELVANTYRISKQRRHERLSELSAALGIGALMHYPVNRLSLGQRMKAEIAAVLLYEPELLILDEPFIGIDASTKETIREMLRELAKNPDVTLILTTHNVEEIERICSRTVFLREGSIAYDGSLDRLRRSHIGLNCMRVTFHGTPPDLQDFPIHRYTADNRMLTIFYDSGIVSTKDLSRYLLMSGRVTDILITQPSVEEIIKQLYKESKSSYGTNDH